METQVVLDHEPCLHPENILFKEQDFNVTIPIQDHVGPQKPVKRQTRQWAAWTHQEEESFFAALRQVGKNFEKITCRVQSKNKDQVRHYYYRLVRRMNKLLGPEFCLDAKNSKDTNAAMLRWWSLLEKYSCKASKLHLKPRRFKIFIETLEHQLLKDRKKTIRKQSQGDNCSTAVPIPVPNHNRVLGNDTRGVKLVLLDSQNVPKLGPAKGSSFKRSVNMGICHSSCRQESTPVKTGRQRRKAGHVSPAAYKKWEKAAIAGVSLVADAAEHLERAAADEGVEIIEGRQGKKGQNPVAKDAPSLSPSPLTFSENNVQTSKKLQLQLFPIDEGTRRALEMDNHNPHLELTLSTRKRISSVLEHLNRKWGNSSIASGELVIFPYWVQRDNLLGHQKWTQDSDLSAADVYALIGSPPVFRLRYGWLSSAELGPAIPQETLTSSTVLGEHNKHTESIKEPHVDTLPTFAALTDHQPEKPMDHHKDQTGSGTKFSILGSSTKAVPSKMTRSISMDPHNNILDSSVQALNIPWKGRETYDGEITKQVEDMDDPKLRNGTAFSAGEWADSLTNTSIGDLLEKSHNTDINPQLPGSLQCHQQSAFSCDSFDAAIAAHVYKYQSRSASHFGGYILSHDSSILDAEETCDAFPFQANTVLDDKVEDASAEGCKQTAVTSSMASDTAVKVLPEAEDGHAPPEDLMDEFPAYQLTHDNSSKNLNNGLLDIEWPDSLGALDLDIPSCRYNSGDLILSDSLSGWSRLIASSVDALQHCSFFGLDKNEPAASTVEPLEIASFSDSKIGSKS